MQLCHYQKKREKRDKTKQVGIQLFMDIKNVSIYNYNIIYIPIKLLGRENFSSYIY